MMDKAYWNSLAPIFERDVLEVSERNAAGTLEDTIRGLAHKDREAVDLGCGAGALLSLLSKRFRRVFAVDFSSALLDRAKARTRARNIDFIQHDLRDRLHTFVRGDITICVNVLIHPDAQSRMSILKTLAAATKPKGTAIVVVPSMESVMHVYRVLVDIQTAQGENRKKSVAQANKLFAKEVLSPAEGIVNVGGTSTKHYSMDELFDAIHTVNLDPMRIERVEYPWSEELESLPPKLRARPPWDWLAVAKKR